MKIELMQWQAHTSTGSSFSNKKNIPLLSTWILENKTKM